MHRPGSVSGKPTKWSELIHTTILQHVHIQTHLHVCLCTIQGVREGDRRWEESGNDRGTKSDPCYTNIRSLCLRRADLIFHRKNNNYACTMFCFTAQFKTYRWAFLALDRHGKSFKRGALILSRRYREGERFQGRKTVLSFPRVSATRWTDQDSGAQRDTSHRLSLPSETWPTNLRTFPTPCMDDTSSYAASCSAAHPIKHQLLSPH